MMWGLDAILNTHQRVEEREQSVDDDRAKDGQNHGRCGTGADSGSPTLRSQPLITGNQSDDERQKTDRQNERSHWRGF